MNENKDTETSGNPTRGRSALMRLVMRSFDDLNLMLAPGHYFNRKTKGVSSCDLQKALMQLGYKRHTLCDGSIRYYNPRNMECHFTFKTIAIVA